MTLGLPPLLRPRYSVALGALLAVCAVLAATGSAQAQTAAAGQLIVATTTANSASTLRNWTGDTELVSGTTLNTFGANSSSQSLRFTGTAIRAADYNTRTVYIITWSGAEPSNSDSVARFLISGRLAATGSSIFWNTAAITGFTIGTKYTLVIANNGLSDAAIRATRPQPSPATGAPTIDGSLVVGQTLTAGLGNIADPNGLPSGPFPTDYTFQWLRDGSDIGGATASTYTLVDADNGARISVAVSFTDGLGSSETRRSAQTSPVEEPPPPPPMPLISVIIAGPTHLRSISGFDAQVRCGIVTQTLPASGDPVDMTVAVSPERCALTNGDPVGYPASITVDSTGQLADESPDGSTTLNIGVEQVVGGGFWSIITEADGADNLGEALPLFIAVTLALIIGSMVGSALKLGGPAAVAAGIATLLVAASLPGMPVGIWVITPMCVLTYITISRGAFIR